MKFGILISALTLSAMLCCIVAQSREEIVTCFDNEECTGTCPELLPSDCASGRITRCGCCDKCVVYLSVGRPCRPFVRNNAECRPDLYCNGGTCHRSHQLQ